MFVVKEGIEVEVVNIDNKKIANMKAKKDVYFMLEQILSDSFKTGKSYYKIKLDCEDFNNEFYAIYVDAKKVEIL